MSPWPSGRYHLGRGQVWLHAENDRSWNSRHWGLAPMGDIPARAFPLYERAAGLPCGALSLAPRRSGRVWTRPNQYGS